jgi:hypothetical protein
MHGEMKSVCKFSSILGTPMPGWDNGFKMYRRVRTSTGFDLWPLYEVEVLY